MCGDRRHSYEYCPLAWDEEPEQVNYLGNYNHNVYDNAPINNSNNQTFQSDPPEPYIDPAVSDFMHQQRKINQMMLEQMQAMSAQLTARSEMIKALMDQLAKRQLREGYGPGELQVETNELESVYRAEVPSVDLGEPGRDPHESDASRVPQPEDLGTGESESDEVDAGSAREPSAHDATRVKTQTEGSTPELKPLPANLRYEFLVPDKSCLVIISADLKPDRTATLLEKLKAHTGAIGCSTMDSKEISWILLMQEFGRVVRVPQKWVLPPVPPDPCTTLLVRVPQKWVLPPVPPDPPSTNQ